jgi:D-alanyl-D-alanine carboxypeptidase
MFYVFENSPFIGLNSSLNEATGPDAFHRRPKRLYEAAAMKRLGWLLCLITVLVVAGCGGSSTDQPPLAANPGPRWTPPDPAALSPQLQDIVNTALAANNIPGALIGVFTPNGSWTSATGFGNLNPEEPIAFNQIFPWRSITKSLTVTVVLQLVAEGQLDLDDPVGAYVGGVPNGQNITLRQLAAMRSGLFNYTKDAEFQQQFGSDLTAPWTDQQLLDVAFSHPVNFTAGSQYEYSNTNTILLGVVAENITGQNLAEMIQERILDPLDLADSLYMTGTQLPSPFVRGYTFDSPNFVELVSNATALSGSGAMAGTLADLRAWGAALVAGTLLPGDLQQQRFFSGPTDSGPFYDSYGLGIGEIRGWWGHTGSGLGYEICIFTEPNSGSQIVVLVNATNQNSDVPADITADILDTLGWPF